MLGSHAFHEPLNHFSPNKIMDVQEKESVISVRDDRNSVPLEHGLSSLSVPRDRYFYQLVTLMIDYSLAHQIGVSAVFTYMSKFFLAHGIRIFEILPWDRKSYLTNFSYPGYHVRVTYIGCIGTHAHGRQVTSLLC